MEQQCRGLCWELTADARLKALYGRSVAAASGTAGPPAIQGSADRSQT